MQCQMIILLVIDLVRIYGSVHSFYPQFASQLNNQKKVSLEWELGNRFPISKIVDPGEKQNLYCSIKSNSDGSSQRETPVLLMCPLSKGACVANCKPLISQIELTCKEIQNQNGYDKVIRYTIKVSSQYKGKWKCQSGHATSGSLKLSVTEKPYITSLEVFPKPAWRGEPMNVTCRVMPMSGIDYITFSNYYQPPLDIYGNPNPPNRRELTVIGGRNKVPGMRVVQLDQYTKRLIIDKSEPGRDDSIHCSVMKSNGLSAQENTEKDKVYYFPDSLYINSTLPNKNRIIKEGSTISITCSSSKAYPKPQLVLMKHRVYDNMTYLVRDPKSITLTRLDNRAKFFCTIEPFGGRKSKKESKKLEIIVEYEPDSVELIEQQNNVHLESMTKSFRCQSMSGSEPKSKVDWSVLDDYRRKLNDSMAYRILNRDRNSDSSKAKSAVLQDSVSIKLTRQLNGYFVVCSVYYKGKIIGEKRKRIDVYYSPDVVELNSDPLGSIQERGSVTLTCMADSANPAPRIEWIKVAPGKAFQNISLDAHNDHAPAKFSGIKLSSSLMIHGISRSDHSTIFKCVISHSTMSSIIEKSYTLRVIYPPSVHVYTQPKTVEEKQSVSLFCRTSGGNPSSSSKYRFIWSFCPVNSSYKYSDSSASNSQLKPHIIWRQQESSHHCIDDLSTTNQLFLERQSIDSGSSSLPRYRFYISGNNTRLQIDSVTSLYRGWFRCQVVSMFTADSRAFGYSFLDVQYSPIIVPLTLERTYWTLGSHLTLQLITHANPISQVKIKWFFRSFLSVPSMTNRHKLRSRSRRTLKNNSNPTSIKYGHKSQLVFKPYGRFESGIMDNYTVYLKIVSLRRADLGEYSCEISNRLGTKRTGFVIFSDSDISIDESSVKLEVRSHKVTLFYKPPTQSHFSHVILRICSIINQIPPSEKTDDSSIRSNIPNSPCKDMQISNPLSGQVSVTLRASPLKSNFRFMVFNNSNLLQMTRPYRYHKTVVAGQWVEMSPEMMIAVIVGVVGIFMLLFIAFVTLIFLKCRQRKNKKYHHSLNNANGVVCPSGGSIHTMDNISATNAGILMPPPGGSGVVPLQLSPQHTLQYNRTSIGGPGSTCSSLTRQNQSGQTSQEFYYLNGLSPGNGASGAVVNSNGVVFKGPMTSGMTGANCHHCYTTGYHPMEARSDNGSDHGSSNSQNYYHPMMLRMKMRDNGEMNSIHSGGSHQSPDLLLTERTSLTSSNVGNHQQPQMMIGMMTNQPGNMVNGSNGGNNNNKLSFLTGRLQSADGCGPVVNEEFVNQNGDVVFATVEDPLNANQTRLITIPTRNFISNGHDMTGYTNFQLSNYLNTNQNGQISMLHPNNNDQNGTICNNDTKNNSTTNHIQSEQLTNNITPNDSQFTNENSSNNVTNENKITNPNDNPNNNKSDSIEVKTDTSNNILTKE